MNHEKKLSRSIRSTLGFAVGTALLLASASSSAAVVCNTPPFGAALPYSIVQDINGLYANFVTGAFANGTVSNWDINPYYNSASLAFWTTPGTGTGTSQIVSSATAVADVLAAGTPIGPSSTFNTANATGGLIPTAIVNGGSGYIGVRFRNESTAAQNYGWMHLTVQTGSTDGFPVTVNGFCYDDTGAAINAGTTPVTLQGFSVD